MNYLSGFIKKRKNNEHTMQKNAQITAITIILIILIIIVVAFIAYIIFRFNFINPNVIVSNIECNINSDCGQNSFSGNTFCQNNDVYQSFTTHICNKPGTISSSCSISTNNQLKQTCNNQQGCSNGQCSSSQGRIISIADFSFNPSTITINRGDSLIWVNNGQAMHTVTSDSGSELNSGTINPGNSYSHIFNRVGTYRYHCNIHPSMSGRIIVR